MERQAARRAFRLAAIYAFVAACWVWVVDLVLEHVLGRVLRYEPADLIKDGIFAGVTGCMILWLVGRQMWHRYRAEAIRCQTEAELRVAHDKLEQRVLARTAELEMANSALQAEILERHRAETELSALLQVSRDVASTLDLKPLLDLILDHLAAMVGYTNAAIFVSEGDAVTMLNHRGTPPQRARLFHSDLEDTPGYLEAMRLRVPVIISDVHGDLPGSSIAWDLAANASPPTPGHEGSWMDVPLIVKDRVIAVMQLEHVQPSYFTPHHSQLALAIANQAAVAIENARLYKEAQRAAALEERQRLARDLHDSLSQALFGIALGANAAQETLSRGGDVGASLHLVLSLADSAIENLRRLIYELRPEVLEREGLTAALARQVAEICKRQPLEATCDLGDEPDLPLEVKDAFYRIAQEALNNTVRHAQARRVEVRLGQTADAIVLEVRDDGIGFVPGAAAPGHLGMQSMRERITRLGGSLDITSTPGHGTLVQASLVPAPAALP